MRRFLVPFVAAGAAVLAVSMSASPPEAHAKAKEEGLIYAKSWSEAVKEARARNALLFATFHKDN